MCEKIMCEWKMQKKRQNLMKISENQRCWSRWFFSCSSATKSKNLVAYCIFLTWFNSDSDVHCVIDAKKNEHQCVLTEQESLFFLSGYRKFHVPVCQHSFSFETTHRPGLTTARGHLTNFPWRTRISFFSCTVIIWVLGTALGETDAYTLEEAI